MAGSNVIKPEIGEDEEITFETSAIDLNLNGRSIGGGLLFLGSQRMYWVSAIGPERNLSVEYPLILLHAVCNDIENWPMPCLYCQLDVKAVPNSLSEFIADDLSMENEEDDDDEQEAKVIEARVVPSEPSALVTLFHELSKMSALNPDVNATKPDNEWFTAQTNAEDIWNGSDSSGDDTDS